MTKWKKIFGFGKKNFGSDTNTEIGRWFQSHTIVANPVASLRPCSASEDH